MRGPNLQKMVTHSGCVSKAHCWVNNIFIVIALLTTSITAEGGSGGDGSSEILGMTTGVAILVLVLVAFVVIGCLLCVLHRQLQIMKATRRRTHIQEMRRANRSHDDDDDDEGLLSASSGPALTDTYKSPAIPTTDKVIIVNAELSVSTPPSGRDGPSQEQEINDTDDHVNALPLLQQHSPKASSAGKPLRFGGGGDVEEGTDSHTLQHSVRKVGSWLSHSAQLLPPLGTPQFMNLRASSFLGIPPASSAATPQAEDGSAVVYVRVNSRQRRSNTMPIRVPPSATGASGGVPDPFGDIPIVSMEETYPRPTTTSGGSGRMIRRSVSLDSQNSDPFS